MVTGESRLASCARPVAEQAMRREVEVARLQPRVKDWVRGVIKESPAEEVDVGTGAVNSKERVLGPWIRT